MSIRRTWPRRARRCSAAGSRLTIRIDLKPPLRPCVEGDTLRYSSKEASMKTLAALTALTLAAFGQTGIKNGEWPTYGGDLGNTRYTPADQINASNFNRLQVAWTFKTDNLGPRPEN